MHFAADLQLSAQLIKKHNLNVMHIMKINYFLLLGWTDKRG